MNTVLSVQGASAPVEKKSFFSKFTRLNMLRLVRAVIPVAVLMMLFPELAMAAGKGTDLMAKGQETVKATFGKDSSIVKWVVLAEVLVGAVMYMMTKNVKFLVGFAILSVFIAVGIRDVLLEDVAQRNIPLSHKKLRRALKAITRSESYLCAMKAGACRYDTEGYVTEHISQEEEVYAAERLDKIRRQNRIKAELQAVLDEQ